MVWRGRTWMPLYKEVADRGLGLGTWQESQNKAVHLYVDSEYLSWYLLCGLHGLAMWKRYKPGHPGLDAYAIEGATCGNCLRLRAKALNVCNEG